MTEPTLLGIAASEAVGQAVVMSCGDVRLVEHGPTPGETDDDGWCLRDKSGAVSCVFGDGADAWFDGSRGLCFLAIPNPMSSAPRDGQPVRLLLSDTEVSARWLISREQWDNGINAELEKAIVTGWLPCHGVTYDIEKMAGAV